MVLVENKNFTERGYVAPTTFLRADKYVSNFNYYGSLVGAANKALYLADKGGSNTVPVGIKTFLNNQTAQTFGINCDFYAYLNGSWQLVDYNWVKTNWASSTLIIYRFHLTTGAGPYYAILDKYYFGVSAITVQSSDPAKVAALDAYWREVQILKYTYNSFVGFLNTLSKRELNTVEQRVYNEGLLLLQNLSNEMNLLKGLYIQYQTGATIGLPVLIVILIIAIISGATAWTISAITVEQQRTKRINDSYELQKWVATKKQEVAAQAQAGTISQQSADSIFGTLDAAAQSAQKVANDAAKEDGLFGNVAEILKWGAIGYLAHLFFSHKKVSNG